MCDMVGQYIQKKEEEKQIKEEQAVKARYWKIPVCYDDDDHEDYTIAIIPKEPDNSLSMGDEHLDTDPIDSLFDEFADELTLLKSISPGINETDCDTEEEIRLIKRLLYDNSSPHLPKKVYF
nr:hypothetical protein [Tanacetum cinerariifolium]